MPPPSSPTLRFAAGSVVVPGDRLASLQRDCRIQPSVGTYMHRGHIYSSRVGKLVLKEHTPAPSQQSTDGNSTDKDATGERSDAATSENTNYWTLSVTTSPSLTPNGDGIMALDGVLFPGQLVLCRVTRLSTQQAWVSILVAAAGNDGKETSSSRGTTFAPGQRPEGVIRQEDLRQHRRSSRTTSQQDQQQPVKVHEAFAPGDLVLARVISLGDARRYLLGTTATATSGSTNNGESHDTQHQHLGVLYAVSATSGEPMIPIAFDRMRCPVTGATEARQVAKPSRALFGPSSPAAAAASPS